jgi:hypothetical protein
MLFKVKKLLNSVAIQSAKAIDGQHCIDAHSSNLTLPSVIGGHFTKQSSQALVSARLYSVSGRCGSIMGVPKLGYIWFTSDLWGPEIFQGGL